jgi:asparagine synthetase B (glutamine-hydrolysing)
MCGLSAIVTLKRQPNGDKGTSSESKKDLAAKLSSSLDLIKHRGPDAQDVWFNPEGTIGRSNTKPKEKLLNHSKAWAIAACLS